MDMGRRPELKSNEKSKGIPIVLEISGCEHVFTAEKVLYLFGASVRGRASERGIGFSINGSA